MSYKEDQKRAAEVARNAMERMTALNIAPHPDNFEVWYAYHADIDAELSRKIGSLLEGSGRYDPNTYLDIKQAFLGEDASQMLRHTTENVDDAISNTLSSIERASSNARNYSGALEAFTGHIDGADIDKAKALVKDLANETKEVIGRNSTLEQELEAARQRIEELRVNLDDARRQSETDGLTGLPNRRAFDLGLQAEMERAEAEGATLSLLVADVDHFKKFNDTHGHKVGDEVLKLVGRVFKSLLKGRDKPARYGGEEFCAILPTTDTVGAVAVAEQIRKAIAAKSLKSARTGESYGQVTLSLGASTLAPGDSPGSLFERADAALYFAKQNGRNRVSTEAEVAAGRQQAAG